jgi:hypothetical protein
LKHKLVLSRVKEIEISSEIIEGRSRSIKSGNGRVTPMKGAESRVEQRAMFLHSMSVEA